MMTRKGACNHCGLCCKPPVMVENPCIERGEDRCKFYTDTLNDKLYGHCLIYAATDIKKARDRKHNLITEAQIKWFQENCIEYPEAKDAEQGRLPPEGCGFTFEVKGG